MTEKQRNKRPRNFDEFLIESLKNENADTSQNKYVTSRNKWINENKAQNVIDKIPSDELPRCEQIDADHSKVGDFIDKDTFEKTYDEDYAVLNELGDNGVLCYAFSSEETRTWWAVRKEKGEVNGLCRIK